MSFPDDTGRARVGLIAQPHGGAIVPAWRLFVTTCLFMIGASSAPVGATPPPQPSSPFIQGQTDRQGWESWFGALTGDYRDGAWYWSGQRSLPNPGSCNSAPPFISGDWTAGCFAAQQRLAASDVRRKTEPDYRLGWNSQPPVASVPAPTVASGMPAPQALTTPQQRQGNATPTQPPSATREWTINPSRREVNGLWNAYVDKSTIERIGSTVKIWGLFDRLSAPYGQEVIDPSWPPGQRARSTLFRVEYDCRSRLARTVYWGEFSEHMGRGMLIEGGPEESNSATGRWAPISLNEGERDLMDIIACSAPGETDSPVMHVPVSAAESSGAVSIQPCKIDWRQCKNTFDLAINYERFFEIPTSCKAAANRKAEYGTPVWPGFSSGGPFGNIRAGDQVVNGLVLVIEPDAQFQNEFGAMVHSTVFCQYDLKTKTVVSVSIEKRK